MQLIQVLDELEKFYILLPVYLAVCPIDEDWESFYDNPMDNIKLQLTRYRANLSFPVTIEDFLSVILHQDDYLVASCAEGKF